MKLQTNINLLTFFLSNIFLITEQNRSYPYHVGVFVYNGFWILETSYFCSGSLIANEWVLTHSRCHTNNFEVKIFYGNDFYYRGQEAKGVFILHPNASVDLSSGIALIKFNKILFSDFVVEAISLPQNVDHQMDFEAKNFLFTGWATDSELVKGLAKGNVVLRESNHCRAIFGTGMCGNFTLGSAKYANPGSPVTYNSSSGWIQIGFFIDAPCGVARFVSLIEPKNLEWIRNTLLVFNLTSQ